MLKVGNTFVDVEPRLAKNFDKDLQRQIGSSLDRVGKRTAAAGKTWSKNITLPLIAAGGALFAMTNEIDKGMATIRTGTGATGDALDELGGSFRQVMTQVPGNIGDAATAIADLNTRTGATGDTLEELATQALRAAKVTGEDLGGMIASTTRLFGDWDVAVKDQAETMDFLFKVSQNTGIGMSSLSDQMVQFGAPLRQMGFGMEESAALLGKFEQEGVNAGLVMGSLRIALGKMAREGEDAPETFRRMADEIASMEDPTEATAMAMDLFGAKAGPDMAAAIREGRFDVAELMATIEGSGETLEAAEKDSRTFGESMSLLGKQAAVALEPLGRKLVDAMETLAPHLERGVELVGALVDKFMNASPTTQKFAGIALAVAAALGPVLIVVGKVMSAVAGLIGVVAKLVTGIARAITFVVRMAVSFVRLTVSAAQAAARVVVAGARMIASAARATAAVVASIARQVAQWVVLGAQALIHAAKVAAAWLIAMGPIAIVIAAVVALVVAIVKNWDTIKRVISAAWEVVRKATVAAWDAVKRLVKGAIDFLVRLFMNFTGPGLIIKHFDTIRDFIGNAMDAARRLVGGAIDGIVSFFQRLPGRITSAARGAFNGLWEAFKTAVNRIIRAWNGLSFTLPSVEVFGREIGGFTIRTPNLPEFRDFGGATRPGRDYILGPNQFELFRPGTTGRIYSSEDLMKAFQGADTSDNDGKTIHVENHFHGDTRDNVPEMAARMKSIAWTYG